RAENNRGLFIKRADEMTQLKAGAVGQVIVQEIEVKALARGLSDGFMLTVSRDHLIAAEQHGYQLTAVRVVIHTEDTLLSIVPGCHCTPPFQWWFMVRVFSRRDLGKG